jgi:2-phospho-L-lactate guanylyltransferase
MSRMTDPAVIARGTTALIPLRADGKRRLAPSLDAPARWRLALAMFDGVVEELATAGVHDVRVLAAGDAAVDAAHQRGLTTIVDREAVAAGTAPDQRDGAQHLRRAVDDGLASCGEDRIRIVVAADLPLLTVDDVTALLATSDRMTVAPTRDGGTGALLLPRGRTIATLYGRGSAAAHIEAARAAGLEIVRLDRTGFAVDLDATVDLDAIVAIARMGAAPGGARCGHHTVDALRELGLLVLTARADRASA